MIDPLGLFYGWLTGTLGGPAETLYGLSLLGILFGVYLVLTSREIEVFVERLGRKKEE